MKPSLGRVWTYAFALLGALGALLSGGAALLPNGIRYHEFWATALEVFAWGIWPAKMLGMGLGDLSAGVWIGLVALNVTLFSLIGAAIDLASRQRYLLLVAHATLAAIAILWCSWLGSFELNASQVLATLVVVAFYALPFSILFSRNRPNGKT